MSEVSHWVRRVSRAEMALVRMSRIWMVDAMPPMRVRGSGMAVVGLEAWVGK